MTESLLPHRFPLPFLGPLPLSPSALESQSARDWTKSTVCRQRAEMDDRTAMAEVSRSVEQGGLLFAVSVGGKKQPVWCRASRPEDSDGLQVWIDTRNVHNVHRGSRFCHRFIFLPSGGGRKLDEAFGQSLPINRAREPARPVAAGLLQAHSQIRPGGIRLECLVPAEAMMGYEPAEHPRLGFTYAVIDRELGEQTFSVGRPMPYDEDPSLWATLELV